MTDADGAARAPRGRYAKSEDVRRRIVDAATDVFAASGFHATTFKEVASRAGISERGLAYQFRSKEDLLVAVMDHHEKKRSERVQSAHGVEALAMMLTVVAEDARTPGLVNLHSLLSAEATSAGHPIHDRYHFRYATLRWYVTAALDGLRASGGLATSTKTTDLAAAFIALLDGLQIQWLYDDSSVDVLDITGAFLEGVLTPHVMSEFQEHCARLTDASTTA